MNFLEQNLSIIAERFPTLFNQLSACSPQLQVKISHDTREKTLIINGIHLTSAYNRKQEARVQANILIPPASEFAWIYGIGLGELPKMLLERQVMKHLFVVIFNPEVALYSFRFTDHSDWLADPRVNLLTAADEEEIHLPFTVAPACLQLADNASSRLRDLVMLELSTPFINYRHQANIKIVSERLSENEEILAKDGDVKELFNRHPGTTIFIVGAGPSLDERLDLLRSLQKKLPIIAVDAALNTLTKIGVLPDYVVSIDRFTVGIAPFFQNLEPKKFKRTPLVYFPVVHRDILEMWPGPRFTAYADSATYEALAARIPKGQLHSAGSVVHAAVDLAVKMQASHIVLLGCDFSFPENKSHAAGCASFKKLNDRAYSQWILNGSGDRVASQPNLIGYLRDLERYIARHPEISFINSSKKGALIHGTSYLENEEWTTTTGKLS